MTLIINEIHITKKKKDAYIVACADSRITYRNSTLRETNKKLFRIEHLNACLSYWGNTRIKSDSGTYVTLSSWLPNFIRKHHLIENLKDFVNILRSNLNKRMHSNDLRQWASGFHLSGFDKNSNPEFYHFSNANWDPLKEKYVNISHAYKEPYADFSERDFENFFNDKEINWSRLKATGQQSYRNGDFKIHESAWKRLDKTFDQIFSYENFKFKKDRDDENVIKYYQFKLKFIGDIYKNWGQVKNVGGPFDVIVLRPRKTSK